MVKQKYKKNYLTSVIFKIDFPDDNNITNFDEFMKILSSNSFEYSEIKEGYTGKVDFTIVDSKITPIKEKIFVCILRDSNATKELQLASKYLTLEYSKYSDSKELLEDVNNIKNAIKTCYKIDTIKRLGLRYVNEIKLKEANQLDWSKYISKDLIGSIEFSKKSEKIISRTMNQIIFKESNDTDIIFNYGIWNSDFPSQINRKEFILDYDCYSEMGCKIDDIPETIGLYNGYIEELFEKSIKKDLREILKIEDGTI